MITTFKEQTKFDPSFLTDTNNLAPIYNLDPNIAQNAETQLQQALQYVTQNPSVDPNGYYKNTLTQSLAEQQHILDYIQAQTAQTSSANNANYLQKTIQNIQNKQGGNTNIVTAGDWSALAKALQENGNPGSGNYGLGGPYGSYADQINRALNNNGKDPNSGMQLYEIGDSLNNSGNLSNLGNIISSQVLNTSSNLTKDQAAVTSGFTEPQSNFASQKDQLANYLAKTIGGTWQGSNGEVGNAGQMGTVTLPQQQSIYATAYQTKQQAASALNAAGEGSSGEKTKTIGNIDSAALNESLKNLQTNENQGVAAQTNLASNQQQEKTAYENMVNQITGASGGNIFGTGASDLVSAYNTNTGAEAQNNIANAEQEIAQKQQSDNWINGILGTLGKAAGTIGGGALFGPVGAVAGGSLL